MPQKAPAAEPRSGDIDCYGWEIASSAPNKPTPARSLQRQATKVWQPAK